MRISTLALLAGANEPRDFPATAISGDAGPADGFGGLFARLGPGATDAHAHRIDEIALPPVPVTPMPDRDVTVATPALVDPPVPAGARAPGLTVSERADLPDTERPVRIPDIPAEQVLLYVGRPVAPVMAPPASQQAPPHPDVHFSELRAAIPHEPDTAARPEPPIPVIMPVAVAETRAVRPGLPPREAPVLAPPALIRAPAAAVPGPDRAFATMGKPWSDAAPAGPPSAGALPQTRPTAPHATPEPLPHPPVTRSGPEPAPLIDLRQAAGPGTGHAATRAMPEHGAEASPLLAASTVRRAETGTADATPPHPRSPPAGTATAARNGPAVENAPRTIMVSPAVSATVPDPAQGERIPTVPAPGAAAPGRPMPATRLADGSPARPDSTPDPSDPSPIARNAPVPPERSARPGSPDQTPQPAPGQAPAVSGPAPGLAALTPNVPGDASAEHPEEPDRDRASRGEVVAGDGAALRAGPGATATGSRPDLARQVMTQVVEHLRQLPSGPVELTLDPVELGRVRMTMTGDGATISVTVTAERPETLDLLRRNIDLLGQELERIGYDNVDFAFARQDGGQGTGNGAPGAGPRSGLVAEAGPDPAPPDPAEQIRPAGAARADGIDIRV